MGVKDVAEMEEGENSLDSEPGSKLDWALGLDVRLAVAAACALGLVLALEREKGSLDQGRSDRFVRSS